MSPESSGRRRRAGPGRRRSGRRSGSASARRRGRASRPPRTDARVGPHHPLAVVLVDVDRHAAERAAPLDHRRVVVRVRDRDRPRCRRAPRPRDGRVVDQPDAVPEEFVRRPGPAARWPIANYGSVPIPVRPALLARSCCGGRARSSSSVVHCWPVRPDVLALVLADRASGGRFRTFRRTASRRSSQTKLGTKGRFCLLDRSGSALPQVQAAGLRPGGRAGSGGADARERDRRAGRCARRTCSPGRAARARPRWRASSRRR